MTIKIRKAKVEDLDSILNVEINAWGIAKSATREMIKSRIETFPDGNLVAVYNERIIGVVFTEIINYINGSDNKNWYQYTDNGFIKYSHNKNGNTLFGVDLGVIPNAPYGTGSKLLEAVGKLVIKYNLKKCILGGRLPMYYKYKHKFNPEEYLKQEITKDGKKFPLDPEVSFYKKAGLKIIKVIPNYYKDPESLNYGVLLVWDNPFYNKWYRNIAAKIFKV